MMRPVHLHPQLSESSDGDSGSGLEDEMGREGNIREQAAARFRRLQWYHEGMTRNTAEAVLLTNGTEGTYLLRDSLSNAGNFTVSVRCKDSVKHFALEYDGRVYRFGIGEFSSMQELVEHFECLPVLGGETGPTVTLRYPYSRDVPEPDTYDLVARHAECGKHISRSLSNTDGAPDMHIASREGYMVKRGALHKNWKKRWFVLQKNELKYYSKRGASKPIKVLDIKDLLEVTVDESMGKTNCLRHYKTPSLLMRTVKPSFLYSFCASSISGTDVRESPRYRYPGNVPDLPDNRLSFPSRIFYAFTATQQEMVEWLDMLTWKIDYYRNRRAPPIILDPLADTLPRN